MNTHGIGNEIAKHIEINSQIHNHLRKVEEQTRSAADPIGSVFLWASNDKSPEAVSVSETMSGCIEAWLEDDHGIDLEDDSQPLTPHIVAAIYSAGIESFRLKASEEIGELNTDLLKVRSNVIMWSKLAQASIAINVLFLLLTGILLYLMR